MWSGSTSTIPTGWALCDGSNGTPDLRNRFIVGAGDSYSVDDTGGSATMAHTHGVDLPSFAGNSGNNSGAVRHDGAATGGNDIASHPHSHSIAHDHPATTSGAASNTENRPPYYALAYIMKLP
jgi:microcystin-dependent protein